MTGPELTEPLVREIHLDASPDIVFSYFTEPEKLCRWLASEATLDPRPGGVNHQTHPGPERDPDGPYLMHGEFIEVDPPNRVVFTWGYVGATMGVAEGSTRVEVDLTATAGGTDLRLTHHDIPAGEAREAHEAGWTQMFGRLSGQDLD